MSSTNYTIGSCGMIMKSGCDTRYSVSGSNILKSGCSTKFSVSNGGKIMDGGSETGFVISGSSIMKESDKGYSLDWMFS